MPVVAAGFPAAAPEPTAATAAQPLLRNASALAFPVKSILTLDRRLYHGDYTWQEEGAPEGRTAIVVDLEAQVLYVYRAGYEIGRAAILYGADDKPTPTGTFKILQKNEDHISNIYNVPMPYMLRLTWDGIAIHASDVEYGAATHGCIGIPSEFAAMLFAEASLGTPVLVTNGWMDRVRAQLPRSTQA